MSEEKPTSSEGPKRSRRIRRVLLGLGAVAALVVVLAVVAVLLVPAEKIQQIAFDQLEANTGLQGSATDASVSIFPLGARLEGLRIEDPSGASEVWTDLQIDLESALVSASLWSILRGSPEIQEVRLVRPRVEIALAEPAPADGGGGTASSQAAPEMAAALGLLSIEDGEIVVHQPTGETLTLSGLDNRASLRVGEGEASGDVEGSLRSFTMEGGELPQRVELPRLEWELGLSAAVDGARGDVEVRRVESSGVRANGDAAWTLAADGTPELDVQLTTAADLAKLWTDIGRDYVDPATLPEGFSLDDFELLAGAVNADVRYAGRVPEADPDDPTAALGPLEVDGTLEGFRVRLIDRTDLIEVDSDFTVSGGRASFSSLELTGALGTVNGSGGVPLAFDAPLTANVEADLDVAAVRGLGVQWWPRLSALAATEDGAEPAGPAEWPTVVGRVQASAELRVPADGSFDPTTGAADAVTWTVRSEQMQIGLVDFTEPVFARGLVARGDLRNARLEEGRVEGPGLNATATLQASGWPERIVVRGDVRASELDLDALQAAMVTAESASLDGRWLDDVFGVRVAHAATGETTEIPAPPAELDARIDLSAETVKTSGYTLRDLGARATVVEQQLDVSDIRGQLGDGSLSGSANVDWTAETPQWQTDLQASKVSATTLLEPFAGPLAQALNTDFSGEIDLDGPLSTQPEQVIAALTGLADLRAESGSLAAEDLLGPKVSRFLGEHAEQWKQLTFDALDADLEVREGKVFFQKLLIRGRTEVDAGGWVGLDGTTNVRLDVRLPAGMTPQLGALQPVADLLQDEQQRIAFGVNVTGPGRSPNVEIDLAELQQRATDRGRDALRDEAQGALDDLIDRNRGGVEDALGDLLGGGSGGSGSGSGSGSGGQAEPDSNAGGQESSLEDKVKEGLGGLLEGLGGKKKDEKKGGGGGGGDVDDDDE